MIQRSGPRRLAILLSLALLLPGAAGCTTISHGARDTWSFAGETFPENPASIVPFFIGLGLGCIVALPLNLISWPSAELFMGDDANEEGDKIFAIFAPQGYLGAGVGIILAAPFYPFGMPFMEEGDPEDDWNDEPEDAGRSFEEGPPGGEWPRVPAPWLEDPDPAARIPRRDGIPAPPFRGAVLEPWEPVRPAGS